MNKFLGQITIFNNQSQSIITPDSGPIFTISSSTITVSMDENQIISTIDGSFQIFKKFDKVILWDFGDGTTILGNTATHSYTQPGIYYISCTCFDRHGTAYKLTESNTENFVKVVNILDTVPVFTNNFINQIESGLYDNILAGSKVIAGEIIITLDKSVTEDVSILCTAHGSNAINKNDLAENLYQHLDSYYEFTDNNNNTFCPIYYDVFAALNGNNVNLYIINNSNDLINFYPLMLNESIRNYSVFIINSVDEINNKNYHYIGRCGIITIFYQDDKASDLVNISFTLNTNDFEKENIILSRNNLNIPTIGTSFEIKSNSLNDSIIVYNNNGLSDSIYDYNRAGFVNVSNQCLLRTKSSIGDFFTKDIIITNITIDNITPLDSCQVDIINSSTNFNFATSGAALLRILPLLETDEQATEINLTVDLQAIDGSTTQKQLSIKDLTFIDINSFTDALSKYYLDPKQKGEAFSLSMFWNIYKTHPVFIDKPNLDAYFTSVFGNGLLESIINKGWNFTDDFANIKTCSIRNLISLLNSIDQNIEIYNNENFSKPNEIEDLLRIISINHAKLIGSTVDKQYDLAGYDNTGGVNRGKLISLDEKIYVNQINNKFIWPKIVAFDKFTKSYQVLNSALLFFAPSQPLNAEGDKFYFSLLDFNADWGWQLILPDNTDIDLNKFYDFYYFIETNDTEQLDSFLDQSTISENIKNYDTWTKYDGSIERLIYKKLIKLLKL